MKRGTTRISVEAIQKLKWYIHYDYSSFSSLMLCVCSDMGGMGRGSKNYGMRDEAFSIILKEG